MLLFSCPHPLLISSPPHQCWVSDPFQCWHLHLASEPAWASETQHWWGGDEIKSGCGQENSNIDGKVVILKAHASSKCQFLWFLASFYFSKTEYRPKKTSGAFRAEVKNRTHQVEICQMRILNAKNEAKSWCFVEQGWAETKWRGYRSGSDSLQMVYSIFVGIKQFYNWFIKGSWPQLTQFLLGGRGRVGVGKPRALAGRRHTAT